MPRTACWIRCSFFDKRKPYVAIGARSESDPGRNRHLGLLKKLDRKVE